MSQVEVITVGELIEFCLHIYRQSNINGDGGEYVSYDRGYICLMAAEIAHDKKMHFNPGEFSRNLGRAVDEIIEGRSRIHADFDGEYGLEGWMSHDDLYQFMQDGIDYLFGPSSQQYRIEIYHSNAYLREVPANKIGMFDKPVPAFHRFASRLGILLAIRKRFGDDFQFPC